MNCVWDYYDEPDEAGKRRVYCVHCHYVSKSRTTHARDRIFGDACSNLTAPRPGREMKNIVQMLGMEPTKNCGCNAKAAEMDRLGPEGCRKERAKLVQWMAEAYETLTVQEIRKAMSAAIKSGLAFSIVPWDICGSLIDEAIRRSERTPNV